MKKFVSNNLLVVFVSIFVVIITIFASENRPHPQPKPTHGMNALGNRLSEYIYYVYIDQQPQILIDQKMQAELITDRQLKSFYANFDWSPLATMNYTTRPDSTWHPINLQGKPKVNYLEFWQKIRPDMQKLLTKNVPARTVKYPVVHFRCSDSPFNKHFNYHMPKTSSVRWMAAKLKERGFSRAIMLSCNQHRSMDQNSCSTYINFYSNIFGESGIKMTSQCNSIMEDFSMMVHSPMLVSLNASSFSFMAGIAKDPKDYISCNLGIELNQKYVLQSSADWILDPTEPLLHKDVIDYNDTVDVIHRLSD